jgi:guanylate cyclase
MNTTFWQRLASRTKPTGMLETIEDPLTIVKATTVGLATAVVVAGFGAVNYFQFDEPIAGWALAVLSAVFVGCWVIYVTTGSLRAVGLLAIVGSTVINYVIHLAEGGYANSGGVLMFVVATVLFAAVLLSPGFTVSLAVVSVVLAVVMAAFEQTLRDGRLPPDPQLATQGFTVVIVGSVMIVVPMLHFLLGRLSFERHRAEGLLLNVLPQPVAAELKEQGRVEARRYQSMSVLFADIVGFTPMSAELDPEEMVERLNTVFTHFDQLSAEHGCEKIRTIGDSYMVAAGVPTPRDDHAIALARVALAMQEFATEGPFDFRIGMNSGPAVAGVIGTTKFQYDVWGDTVNTASRMESHGQPGKIQITEATHELIHDRFHCSPCGPIEVKGKGLMPTWHLDGEKLLPGAGPQGSS